MCRFLTVLLLLSLIVPVEILGERNAIRVTVAGQPDTWTLERIVESATAGLTDDRSKALALHKFGMAHQIHFVGPREEYSYVSDALKVFSVYGYSLCGISSAAMSALYNLAGMKARRRFIVGHVVPEVFFEGSWNYIDTDMFGYVLKQDGSLASVDELLEDPELFDHPVRPDPFFPFDGAENMKPAFTDADGLKDCHPYGLSHILSLNLRTHEKVICYYRPQKRYYVHPGQMQRKLSPDWPHYWIEGPIRQNSLAWTDESPAAYGNALFEYEPELSSEEFLTENPSYSAIVSPREEGRPEMAAANPGTAAQLILEVSTPWVIAGLINDPTNFEDNTEAAVVSGWFWRAEESDENRIEISVDGGRKWYSVWTNPRLGAVPFRVDVTNLVEGRYSYLLRFRWIDRAGSGQVGLSGLRLQTWTELSPMALPHLEAGQNELKISIDNTRAYFVESRWHEREELYGQKVHNLGLAEAFPFLRRTDQDRPGSVTFGLGIEETVEELRLSVQAGCTENERPRDVKVEFLISKDKGESWEELSRFSVDPEHQQPWMWFNHVIKDSYLDGNQIRLKIIVHHGSLAAIKVGSRTSAASKVPSDLRFTHVWTEGNTSHSSKSVLSGGTDTHSYTVNTSGDSKLVNRQLVIEALPAGWSSLHHAALTGHVPNRKPGWSSFLHSKKHQSTTASTVLEEVAFRPRGRFFQERTERGNPNSSVISF